MIACVYRCRFDESELINQFVSAYFFKFCFPDFMCLIFRVQCFLYDTMYSLTWLISKRNVPLSINAFPAGITTRFR